MTNIELIRLLQEFPGDAIVKISLEDARNASEAEFVEMVGNIIYISE